MPQVCTQTARRAVRSLPFCYLCGEGFGGRATKNRDHVPPKSIFASADRGTPLILPTHVKCNVAESDYDEIIGQLIAPIHGKYPKPNRMKLDVHIVETGDIGGPFLGLVGINVHKVIRRWLRGFHSALYSEYLPNDTMFHFHPPLPVGHTDEHGEVRMDEVLPHHELFVKQIKQNRVARTLDRVVFYNNKCVYECFWGTADAGQQICIFALNVYDWSALAATENFCRRGCVGMYMPAKGRPVNATTGTRLHFPVSNSEKLDPFGS
jgi:hypothetical protein